MVIVNGHSTSAAPNHHRQNRCRERPGSRTRRNKSRKSDLQSAIHDGIQEGIVDAHNSGVYLPSDRYVSPMLRQTFDQSWARWKLREAEEKEALALIEAAEQAEKLAMEREQIKLFGGDVGDDELYKLGILYDDTPLLDLNTVKCSVPRLPSPLSTIRPSRRRPNEHDAAIDECSCLTRSPSRAKIPASHNGSSCTTTMIQRRSHTLPLSLPTEQLASGVDLPGSSELEPDTTLLATDTDWVFITKNRENTVAIASPSSEAETWILLSDDS